MLDAHGLRRTWSFLAPFLLALAGCAAETDAEPQPTHDVPAVTSGFEEEQPEAFEQELSYRPSCSQCANICRPLRGYFKSLCTRACQKVCVTPCEQCKNECKSLQGQAKQTCLNDCAASPVCGGNARCGNGRVEGAEQCDDGNTKNGDGCSKTCQIEPPVCGNRRVEEGETCDDGNTTAGDGCSATCQIEPPPPVCGNGVVEAGELCDDGNLVACDGCEPSCAIPYCGDGIAQCSERCDDGNGVPNDGCSPTCNVEVCGDGITQPPRESCDDGNVVPGDGCSATCAIEPRPECGDGSVDSAEGEECDDGNTAPNDGCSALCKVERCGDGVTQTPREQCDDGNLASNDGCSAGCVIERCGDGIVQPPESCDDGNTVATDGCSATCRSERCGDGIVQPGEQCDDGNTVAGDGCQLDCTPTVTGPSCADCRNNNCTNFQGVDLVAGCFTAVNPEFGADPTDPTFIQDCANVVSCARSNDCAYDPPEGPLGCYCGSASHDDCFTVGPASDAKCVPQWQAAYRSTQNTEIVLGLSDLSRPLAWAYYLLDCDRNACNSPSTGDCTTKPGTASSKPSYIVPVAPGVSALAILTVGDSPNSKPNGAPYRLVGIPDGAGAFDNGDGTFTMLVNHELGNTEGIARAHGGAGAFVSRWIVRKSDLGVLHGEDLIKTVQVWNTATSSYGAGSNVAFGRFCSADLPGVSATYDSASALGYDGHLFFNGEETGAEGRAWAHALDGTSWELPRLGKASWENVVASPHAQTKTVVIGIDDTTPGEVYVYVGNKTNSGSPIDRAGLTNGTLYGVAVTGFPTEPSATGIPAGTFTMANLGNVENSTGAVLQTASIAANVTRFNRPEDGAWDPANPADFYFVTTNTPTTPSRLWRLRFANIAQPELGGSIEMMLDGSEGQVMLDNLGIDARGHIMLQEDVGNNARIGQLFRYDIATDRLTTVAQHDPALFTSGSPTFMTQDEEASGIIDATALLGPGWWLLTDQVHASISGELVQHGQLNAIFDPGSL